MEKIAANPFQAGGRLRDPKHFVGRDGELRQILSRVANMDNVSVVGPRRIGKSSLLHHIVATGQQRLNQSYQFYYLDLQPLDSAEEFY
ncbi:MAG: ATP-binding protein, partial [Blastocatellia bacterium]